MFNPAPSSFFGAAYSLAASVVGLVTATKSTGITVGTTFTGFAGVDTLATATPHGLLVGDRIRVYAGTGLLPTGLVEDTDYWVRSVPLVDTLTLSATKGGAVLDITDDGGTDHLIKSMGTLDELTDAEANATTGDWRKVLFAIMEMIYSKWSGLATADRPSKVVVTRSSSVNNITSEITRTYTVRVTLSPGTIDVSSE